MAFEFKSEAPKPEFIFTTYLEELADEYGYTVKEADGKMFVDMSNVDQVALDERLEGLRHMVAKKLETVSDRKDVDWDSAVTIGLDMGTGKKYLYLKPGLLPA